MKCEIMEVFAMEITSLREIAVEPPLKSDEERKKFMGVVGALALRWISLSRASEIMEMNRDVLLGLLDALGVEYSYLDDKDVAVEKRW